jgi:nicotinate-nucleotide adenylyltransferase
MSPEPHPRPEPDAPGDDAREIALFGGSFNPPHMGHVFIAAHVLATEPIGQVWLLPCHEHAFGKGLAPFDLRARMLEAVARPFGGRARVDLIERDLGGTSRTIDTVRELRRRHPGRRFAWVGGADLLEELPRWKEPEALARLVRFILLPRRGVSEPDGGRPLLLPDISSTEVRARAARRLSLTGWVPEGARALIEHHQLYQDG